MIPKERKIDVTFSLRLPIDATGRQLTEWLDFKLGYGGGIATNNPLHEYELEGFDVDWQCDYET